MEGRKASAKLSAVLSGIAFTALLGVIVVPALFLEDLLGMPEERVVLGTNRLLTRPAEEVFEQAVSLGQGESVRIRLRAEGGRIDFLTYTGPPEASGYQELIVRRGVEDREGVEWLVPMDGVYRFRFCLSEGSDSANVEARIAVTGART